MNSPVRIDKWLWAARFFKTRSQAREAISGGKIHLNGFRVKPGRAIKPGDSLRVQRGEEEYIIEVVELSTRRGAASVAQTLYEESEESRLKRQQRSEQRQLERQQNATRDRRPDKRQRRRLVRDRREHGVHFALRRPEAAIPVARRTVPRSPVLPTVAVDRFRAGPPAS